MRRTHWIAFGVLAILIVALLGLPMTASAQISVGISVRVGPPPLPVYEQPICPGGGYIWTPGYWAYGDAGYYWVPGTWVLAPVGMLWTPGYWGWGGGVYRWHAGYWGPHVGFYGGINYGYGYTGVGFVGGRWEHGVFAYNTAVMHVDTRVIHTTYVDRTVIREGGVARVSYNGGEGGVVAHPTAAEMSWEHERHIPATEVQVQHEHYSSTNHANFYSENHGRPAVAATARPGEFTGHDVMAAHGAPNTFHPPTHTEAEVHSNGSGNSGTHSYGNPNNATVHSNPNTVHTNGNGSSHDYGHASQPSKATTPHDSHDHEHKPEKPGKPQR
ncbi:MAG TPA: YXWGXW repeat-containing protein [Candidatus Acidoferrum sp.]|nr:YXWGXW repeat-containing protein [Candidatus Acidoferrum sp.]